MKVYIENVTPEMAMRWLSTNTHNRNLSNPSVKKYQHIMEKGQWSISNDAIIFDTNGVLLNGQHRLSAVIQSNTTQPFIIGEGFDPSTQMNMDYGRRRTFPEHNKINYPDKPWRQDQLIAGALKIIDKGVAYNEWNMQELDQLWEKYDNIACHIWHMKKDYGLSKIKGVGVWASVINLLSNNVDIDDFKRFMRLANNDTTDCKEISSPVIKRVLDFWMKNQRHGHTGFTQIYEDLNECHDAFNQFTTRKKTSIRKLYESKYPFDKDNFEELEQNFNNNLIDL